MANTVSLLSYANTFGEWVVNTNTLAKENNDLAANNYVKSTGTLFLNDNSLGLQVANNAIFGGQLQSQGVGSSAYVQNNLRVDGQVYFTNTSLGLTNSGQANIGGPLLALGANTGLTVANTANVGRNLNVAGNTTVEGNSTVEGDSRLYTVTTTGVVNVANNLIVTQNAYIDGSSFADHYYANIDVVSPRIVVTNAVYGPTSRADFDLMYSNNATVVNGYINTLQANSSVNTQTLNARTFYAQSVSTPSANVTGLIDANNATAYINNLQTNGQLSVGGNFVINGATVYNSNVFTINAGSATAQFGSFIVNRGSDGANAEIRWNQPLGYWDMKNVTSNTFYRVVTDEYINDTLTSTSNTDFATANVANTLNNVITAANTFLQAAVASAGSYANSGFLHANAAFAAANNVAPQIEPAFAQANASFSRANTSANAILGTTGSGITPTSGGVTFASNNGVVISTPTGNTAFISTSQDLRTSATPTFAGLSLSNPLAVTQGGTGGSSSTAALINLLPDASNAPAGYVLSTGGVGSYYWAAGGSGGGGGTQPGTRINTTRSFPTVNTNQTAFTTPTYTPGAGQLRVYIDGVRQYPSDYTETNSTSVTLGSTIPAGSSLMIEVDAYTTYAYYANNIPFTSPFGGIVTTANTIQLALQDIETRKATLASPTFTGLVNVPTAPTSTSNTVAASTAYVTNRLGDGGTYSLNISGNAARANTAAAVAASGITGQTGMWTSTARPGPYRLYRRDNNSDFSVQTYYTGSRWRLYGYNGDTEHADTHVGYADSAGSVPWTSVTGRPTAVSSFTNDSGYQTSSGSVNYASSAGSVAWSNVSGRPTTLSGLTNDTHIYGENGIFWGMGAVPNYTYTLSNGSVDDTSITFNVPSEGWWSFNDINIYFRGRRYYCNAWLNTTAYVTGALEVLLGTAWYAVSARTWDFQQVNALETVYGDTRVVGTQGSYYYGGWGKSNDTTFNKPFYIRSGAQIRLRLIWSTSVPSYNSSTIADVGNFDNERVPNVLNLPSAYNYQWRAYPTPISASGYWNAGAGVQFSATKVG
jgi:hypothetical protein